MTGEAHRAVVTDHAVNTQVFLWHEGCIYIYIFFFLSFFLSFGCAGSSLLCGLFSSFADLGYSPVAGHMFLVAGASHCGAQNPGHRLMVVSQGLS